ncbi:hypothetical protein [Streptomyces sp. NRRL B-3648]|uniref:hypothetical protein n=1 Tax=Streptomyces sp. NRRL B-3648 TaxID=1519493 RepID=UPI000A4169AA|nr:hypothetical protein [Streptomyces sp. NRRL B-3648]
MDASGNRRQEAELAEILAVLRRLVKEFGDGGDAVYTEAEVERREFAAYAHGWKDALASLPAQLRRPELTLLEGGEVIPFPERQGVPEEGEGACGDGPVDGGAVPAPPRPRFEQKSPRSKAPTIPKVERGRSRRKDRRDLFDH